MGTFHHICIATLGGRSHQLGGEGPDRSRSHSESSEVELCGRPQAESLRVRREVSATVLAHDGRLFDLLGAERAQPCWCR